MQTQEWFHHRLSFYTVSWYTHTKVEDNPVQEGFQGTSLPERVAEANVDTAVALTPVCTVHFNLELTIVSSTCCKSANGKNLKQEERSRSGIWIMILMMIKIIKINEWPENKAWIIQRSGALRQRCWLCAGGRSQHHARNQFKASILKSLLYTSSYQQEQETQKKQPKNHNI